MEGGQKMLIGDRIKELRTRQGLSQAELGDKVETDGSVISRWETNRAKVSQKYIVKLANALGTSTDYLLGETDDPKLEKTPSLGHVLIEDGEPKDKRLIIKNRDMYIDLPETAEGFEILRKFFDMQATQQAALAAGLA